MLAAANGATLSSPVARSVVAPGPGVARDCRMLAVWLDSIEALPGSPGEFPGGGCALLPVINLRLLFVADCVPTPSDQGKPPPAADVTAWSLDYLADVEAVWDALADAAAAGTFGECSTVSVQQSTQSGPLGGTASTIIPVRIAPL
jgi:hypothetical protein